mmetsp:Transcript_25838/g.43227  ORF Transcript_25838/g.43227 Transcript_25838/m.43227 type:complete len:106 (+) Transcript_25838:4139-4456(+)
MDVKVKSISFMFVGLAALAPSCEAAFQPHNFLFLGKYQFNFCFLGSFTGWTLQAASHATSMGAVWCGAGMVKFCNVPCLLSTNIPSPPSPLPMFLLYMISSCVCI